MGKGKRLEKNPAWCTVKKFNVIPGLVLIKSSWDCVKYFQRLEFFRKYCYIHGQLFSLLRM
jgi:hypothetical protein